MIYVNIHPTRLTLLGWTFVGALIALMVATIAFAPGNTAVVLFACFLLLLLVMTVLDQIGEYIHKPEKKRDRNGGA